MSPARWVARSLAATCASEFRAWVQATCSRSSGETSSVPRARLNRQNTSGSVIMPPARSSGARRKSASCTGSKADYFQEIFQVAAQRNCGRCAWPGPPEFAVRTPRSQQAAAPQDGPIRQCLHLPFEHQKNAHLASELLVVLPAGGLFCHGRGDAHADQVVRQVDGHDLAHMQQPISRELPASSAPQPEAMQFPATAPWIQPTCRRHRCTVWDAPPKYVMGVFTGSQSHLLAAWLGRLAGELQAELFRQVHHGLRLRHQRLQVLQRRVQHPAPSQQSLLTRCHLRPRSHMPSDLRAAWHRMQSQALLRLRNCKFH